MCATSINVWTEISIKFGFFDFQIQFLLCSWFNVSHYMLLCIRSHNRSQQVWRVFHYYGLMTFKKLHCDTYKYRIFCKETVTLVSWVWPHTSWLPHALLKLHRAYHTQLFTCSLPWLPPLRSATLHFFIFTRSVTRCTFLLRKRRSKHQLCPFLTLFFFFQELVLMTHMSSRLGTPCSSVRGQGSNQDTPWTSIPVACPFLGAVIYVPYGKPEFRTFGSQPKAVDVLTNFLAVGICVYFGNTLIHFVMTVIV